MTTGLQQRRMERLHQTLSVASRALSTREVSDMVALPMAQTLKLLRQMEREGRAFGTLTLVEGRTKVVWRLK